MKRIHIIVFVIFFMGVIGCQNNTGPEDQEEALSDSVSYTGMKNEEVKLVKEAEIQFKVKDVTQTARQVSSLVQSMGGMVFDFSLQSITDKQKELKISNDSLLVISASSPTADITVRVPSGNLEKFMYRVADLGYYTGSSHLHVDDKSLEFLQNSLKQRASNQVMHQMPSKKSIASAKTTQEIMEQSIARQIENRMINADVNYSLVSLKLFQNPVIRREVIANYVLSDYGLPLGQRFSNAISAGSGYFFDFLLAIVHLWMFLLAGILLYILYRYSQRKGKVLA